MIDLFEAAVELQSFCDRQGWRSCFIGGLAVQRWGEPRVTRDIDLTLVAGFGREDQFINKLTAAYPSRIEDAANFARRNRVLLLKTPASIGIDISLGALQFERELVERATSFSFAPDVAIRTCSAEDLIVLKLFASRPLDIRDAEGVALREKGQLDWRYVENRLRPLAEAKEDSGILDTLDRIREL